MSGPLRALRGGLGDATEARQERPGSSWSVEVAGYTADVTGESRTVELFLARDATSVSRARVAVVDVLAHRFTGELVDRAELLVSELVANAVRYGQGSPYLFVHRGFDHVRVEVGDDGPTLKALDTSGPGYGLRILETFADRWGLQATHGDGKKIWFELDAHDPPVA